MKIINRLKGISEYNFLQTISLFYIVLPTLIFLLGWLKPLYSIPLIVLVLIALIFSIKSAWGFIHPTINPPLHLLKEELKNSKTNGRREGFIPDRTILLKGLLAKVKGFSLFFSKPIVFYLTLILLVIIAVLFSGAGGFSVQDADYLKHNAFFLDLTEYTWPLAYAETGTDDLPRMLNAYLAYYLPSALVGKVFGFTAGYFFSFIWVCIGLFLTLMWIKQFLGRRLIFYLFLFVIFGEIASFGWLKYIPSQLGYFWDYGNWLLFDSVKPEHVIFLKDYNYKNPMVFDYFYVHKAHVNGLFWGLGNNHAFISNGPHHLFPSWVCILMIFHDAVIRKSIARIGYVFAFVPFVSAFMAIGLAPFLLLAVIQSKFKGILTFQNFIVAPLLLAVAGLFLISNNAQFIRGWIWEFASMQDIWPYLMHFFIFSFGIYLLVMHKNKFSFPDQSMIVWLYLSVIVIMLFSFYRIGLYMDFQVKGSNPAWIIFQVCVITSISISKTKIDKIRSSILILCLLIAGFGYFITFKTNKTFHLFTHKITEQNSIHLNVDHGTALDQSIMLLSDGKSFFWEVLAKEPVFTKN